jgi:hypothetical protein
MRPHCIAGAALATILSGCFNDSEYAPTVFDVNEVNVNGPSQVSAGVTQIVVHGTHFGPGVVISWNGKPQATTYQDSGLANVTLDDGLTNNLGIAQVTADNGDGFRSQPAAVPIVAGLLKLKTLSPPSANPGAGAFTLTLKGSGFAGLFVSPAIPHVLWNGTRLDTTAPDAATLTAQVPAALVAATGIAAVQVLLCANPGCNSIDFSNTLTFPIGTSTLGSMSLPANDLVWDATRARLYAASQGSIVSIDPATAAEVTVKTIVSGTRLAISDQDQFVYAFSAQGGPTVRYTLPDFSGDTTISAGSTIAVAPVPGAPGSAALAFFNTSSQFEIAIADGASLRTQVANFPCTSLTWGADASTLYALESDGFVEKLTVDSTGVTQVTNFATMDSFRRLFYDAPAHRLHGDGSSIVDEQGAITTTLTLPGTCLTIAESAADDQIFLACAEDGVGLTLRSYDPLTGQNISFVLLNAVPLSTSQPGPSAMARFGTDGLAVAAGSTVYLYRGAFVH